MQRNAEIPSKNGQFLPNTAPNKFFALESLLNAHHAIRAGFQFASTAQINLNGLHFVADIATVIVTQKYPQAETSMDATDGLGVKCRPSDPIRCLVKILIGLNGSPPVPVDPQLVNSHSFFVPKSDTISRGLGMAKGSRIHRDITASGR